MIHSFIQQIQSIIIICNTYVLSSCYEHWISQYWILIPKNNPYSLCLQMIIPEIFYLFYKREKMTFICIKWLVWGQAITGYHSWKIKPIHLAPESESLAIQGTAPCCSHFPVIFAWELKQDRAAFGGSWLGTYSGGNSNVSPFSLGLWKCHSIDLGGTNKF